MFENSDGLLRYAGHQPAFLWPCEVRFRCAGRRYRTWRAPLPTSAFALRARGRRASGLCSQCARPSSHTCALSSPFYSQVKPGRWLHALSKMAVLLASCNARLAAAGDARRFPLPPIFDACTRVISPADELAARDAYWRAVTELRGPATQAEAAEQLRAAAAANPFVAEPHALLAQLALQAGDLKGAEAEALRALKLLCDWGTVRGAALLLS